MPRYLYVAEVGISVCPGYGSIVWVYCMAEDFGDDKLMSTY